MQRRFAGVLASLLCLTGGVTSAALAAEAPPPVLFEVTEAASVLYNGDNRDSKLRDVTKRTNDQWGLFYNRLNLQATHGPLTLSVRVDSAWFYTSPSPGEIANDVASELEFESPEARATFLERKVTEAGRDLSTRYIDWTYPAKYSLLYTTRDFDLTIGDTTAQLGRGIVLSVRKIDELASDTTVRGVRATGRLRAGDTRLKLTALGGALNPLRIDEASGRYLGVHDSVTPGFLELTEALMPHAVETDFVTPGDCAQFLTCTYAPDRVLAGGVEVALPGLTFGTQASLLMRQEALSPDASRTADRILTLSQSIEVPTVFEHGSLYVEGAIQDSTHDDEEDPEIDAGHALYVAASWAEPRFSVLMEGKHYRRLLPLSANVDTGRAGEYSLLAYNLPPTTQEVWNDTEFGDFNTCVTGGRVRADAHLPRAHTVYGWLGHYVTFAESDRNQSCSTSGEDANRVWDSAVGLEVTPRDSALHADVSVGSRFDASDEPLRGADGLPTDVFYRELYLRYTASIPVSGRFALELQGFHRRRRETFAGYLDPWLEGDHSTGIEWGERVGAALGVEYDTRTDRPNTYFNLMATYRPSDAVSLGLFVGQRRGGLRCVGGMCRRYPPFEGGRLDVTVRY